MKLLLITTLSAFSVVLLSIADGSRIVGSLLRDYRRVLSSMNGGVEEDRRDYMITADDLRALIELHDDDFYCNDLCTKHLRSSLSLTNGSDSISYGLFEKLVDQLYGDMISDDPMEPQEIHLSLTGNPTEMTVMWTTKGHLFDPYVEYKSAVADDSGWLKSPAVNYTYEVPMNWWPTFEGVIYKAKMDSLTPSMDYVYRVRGYDHVNKTLRSSEVFTFRASPMNDPFHVTKIATLADQGTFMLLGFAVQKKLSELQDQLGIELATVTGDLSYAGLSSAMPRLNITSEDEFEHVWDLYGIQSQSVAATRPWMVTNGNHERFYNYSAYRNRYSMPYEHSGGSEDGFWYSFNYGNVHYVSISSEHDLSEGSPQRLWLMKDLSSASEPQQRSVVPWIVLAIHKPLYCSAKGTPGGYADALESLCLQFDVDLTITGHMHLYERVHPVSKGVVTCYPKKQLHSDEGGRGLFIDVYHSFGRGPVHVVQGNAGAAQGEQWYQPAPAWSAIRFANGYITPNISTPRDSPLIETTKHWNYTDTFGFGVVTAYNRTHLHYSMVPLTGTLGTDQFWVVKTEREQQ